MNPNEQKATRACLTMNVSLHSEGSRTNTLRHVACLCHFILLQRRDVAPLRIA